MPEFYIGLDLGQAQDYTALAVIERVRDDYQGRHLERFRLGTTYPAIVQRVTEIVSAEPLAGQAWLVVDATGVGRPVLDMLRRTYMPRRGLVGVFITGGNVTSCEGDCCYVPKRDLVATVQVLLQAGRLKFAEGLPEVPTLIKEMLAFQVRITNEAHDTYGAWREGAHDDLILAVAMACWYAGRERPTKLPLPSRVMVGARRGG